MNASRIVLILILLIFIQELSFGQNTSIDAELGRYSAEQVESRWGSFDGTNETNYLNQVLDRLVDNLENPLFNYSIRMVPELTPNAFALPGGHLYITTGMIPILSTEDELACILGHEIIHSNNRHSVQQIKKSIVPSMLEIPGNLLGVINKDLGEVFNKPIETSNELIRASYGRKLESEADLEGVQLAVKSGYDPDGMISSLSRLSGSIEVLTHKKEEKSHFNDHPYTPDRVSAIEKMKTKMDIDRKKPVSRSFLLEFDGLMVGKDPAQGLIRDNTFLHPDLNFKIEFPKGWLIENRSHSVEAYKPNKKAAVFVHVESFKNSPQLAAQTFLNRLKNKDRKKLRSNNSYVLGDKKGQLLTFKDKVNGVQLYAFILWIEHENHLFRLTGISTIDSKYELDIISKSFDKLDPYDKESIQTQRLRIVQALSNETIRTLSERCNNELSNELTRTINDKKKGEKLIEGELIKIIVSDPYFQ